MAAFIDHVAAAMMKCDVGLVGSCGYFLRRIEATMRDSDQQLARCGYNTVWIKLRAMFIRAHPLCRDCVDRDELTATEEVHHVETIEERPDLRLIWETSEHCVSRVIRELPPNQAE